MTIHDVGAPKPIPGILGEHGRELAGALADCIQAADAVNTNGWEVTLEPSGRFVRVNAGPILVAEVFRNRPLVHFAVMIEDAATLPSGVEATGVFKALPAITLARFRGAEIETVWPALRESGRRAVAAASKARKRVPWYWAHSQAAVQALGELAGRPLPSPGYLSESEKEETVEALYEQFLEDYGAGLRGARHAEILAKSRVDAARNYAQLLEMERAGTDLTDAVLAWVLPHVGSKNNLARGAWVSVAPAINKDIQSWFEGSRFYKREDWPNVARAIWKFMSKAIANPTALEQAVLEFQQSGYSRGFQAGMVTPFLNAVSRDAFAIFNSKSRSVINRFAGAEFDADLSSYPAANGTILEWSKARASLFSIPGLDDLRPHEAFDMFCHWLVAEIDYFDDEDDEEKANRVWKIDAGEKASTWDEWRRGGYVALAYSQFEDLSQLSRAEFVALRDRVAAEGQGKSGLSKAGLERAWRFRNIKVGEAVVANRGTSEVLGVGEVTGNYYFVPGEPFGHRMPVRWTDLTKRVVSKGDWKRTLMELTEEDLAEILGIREKVPEAPEPRFSPKTFELLRFLEENPTRETYFTHKEALKQFVERPLVALFRAAVDKLPARVIEAVETEQSVYSRFLKNDYGRGGAWPWLWAAAYPKGGRRVDGAQMYIFVEAGRLDMGFYIEMSANEHRKRLERNLERFGTELREPLLAHWRELPFDYGYRTEDGGTVFGPDGSAWFDQVSQPGGTKGHPIRVGRTWKPEEVTGLGVAALADALASTWRALFPLELMCIHEDPREEIRRYLQLESGVVLEPPPPPVPPLVPPADAKNPLLSLSEISAQARIPEHRLEAWVRAIGRKGQAILYGPPGTGKTFIARKLADHLVGGGNGFVDLLQFHPSYAYEDFIQGLRPVSGDGGTVRFEVIEGRFLEFCRKAEARSGRCVLILDEINRANLSRVFGELMYLLEYRDEAVPLAGGRTLRIPGNVRILGTMNTADRSIALVDHALRRRFAFLSLQPEYDVLKGHFDDLGYSADGLIALLRRLNDEIGDANYAIGISFFLVGDPSAAIEQVWRMEIEPYLEELFFDQPRKLEKFRWDEIEGELAIE